MTSILESYALWLADYYLLATLLVAGALLVLRIVKQPAALLAIAKSSLTALALLAVLVALPGWSFIHILSHEPTKPLVVADAIVPAAQVAENRDIASTYAIEEAAPNVPRTALPSPVTVEPSHELRPISWSAVFASAHFLGAAIVAMWFVAGLVAARRLRTAAHPAPAELWAILAEVATPRSRVSPKLESGSQGETALRGVELHVSDDVDVAVALGIRRPTVLLPTKWIPETPLPRSEGPVEGSSSPLPHREGPGEGSPRDALRTVLAHEAAHLRNRDLHWLAASRVLMILLWAQPLYWLLRRSMRLNQEALADAAAADVTSRQRYAEQLVAWARDSSKRPAMRLSTAVGLWEAPSQLRQRIAILLNERFTVLRDCSRRCIVFATLLLVVTAALLSLVTLQPSTKAAEGTETASASANVEGTLNSGTVVDERTGKPISEAKVVVRRMTSSTHPWPILAETEHLTAADGTYTFTIPPKQLADDKLYIELDVTHPDYAPRTGFGYALSMIRKNEKRGARSFFDRVELEPAEPILGLVKTPDGEVAARMPVLAYSKAEPKNLPKYGSWVRGETDADGRFRLNVTKNGHAILWLLPDDYSQETHVLKDRRGDLGAFVLEDGVRLTGQVFDSQGAAIPNVWVNADLVEGPAQKTIGMPVADHIERSALTDADGRFKLAPLPPGTYRIIPDVDPDENPRRDRDPRPLPAVFVPQRITVSSDENPSPLQLRAAEMVMIEAQIYDSAGKPRSGHDTDFFGRVGDARGEFYHSVGRPDENGHIVLKVPKGIRDAELTISSNEHQAVRNRRGSGGGKQAVRTIKFGTLTSDQRGIEIYYYTAPIVIVAARDLDGNIISGFKPAVFYREGVKPREVGTRWISGVEGEVNFERQEDGRWRSSQLLPNEKFILTVLADGYETAARTMELNEGEIKEIDFELPKSSAAQNDASVTPANGNIQTADLSSVPFHQLVDARLAQHKREAISQKPTARPPALLSYGDGKPDGKKSYGGSGHMIRFEMPEGVDKIRGLRIHGSRYGYPKAPDEDFEITFLNDDRDEILHSEAAPYHLFKRGKERWVRVMFDKEVELPEKFWVALNFNAERTKGVYVSYDTSTKGQHSRVGRPGDEDEPKETDFGGDWMVQVMLPRPD